MDGEMKQDNTKDDWEQKGEIERVQQTNRPYKPQEEKKLPRPKQTTKLEMNWPVSAVVTPRQFWKCKVHRRRFLDMHYTTVRRN